jgi:hypothetical protein
MVLDIVQVFLDAMSGLATGFIGLVTDSFAGLVYNSVDGLSDIAVWGLAFGAIAIVLGVVQRFIK